VSSDQPGLVPSPPARVNAELLEAVERVLEPPHGGDSVATEREEVDLVNVLESAAGGRVVAPLAQVGGRAGETTNDGVALRHELDHFHVDVREGAAEGAEPLRAQAITSLVNNWSMSSSRPPLTASSTKRRTVSLLSTPAG
jgi:hypothetical protein